MSNIQKAIPDHTAVRVALWRALHVQNESAPHVFEDEIGLKLIAPTEDWKSRPDMHPQGTMGYRASIVGRARFIEDLVIEQSKLGVDQYVILGAGLDSFAQRRPEMTEKLTVYEIDQPETQNWKRQRLLDLGFGVAKNLKLVPVDFEAGESWQKKLTASGFNSAKPAVITSTGVTMYLTREANLATLKEMAKFAHGTTLAMTFMLPLHLLPEAERPQHAMIYERAKASGTPFISFFSPEEMLELAREAGFKSVKHVSREEIIENYFSQRTDGFAPSAGEEYLVATT